MGVSTDAILFYGFDFEEQCPWDNEELKEYHNVKWHTELDWETCFAFMHGIKDPSVKDHQVTEEWKAYREKVKRLVKSCECVIGTHCSAEYPMYYVAIAKSVVTACRGSSEKISSLEIGPDWDSKLNDFCDKLKVDVPSAPGWLMVSYWG